MNLIMLLIVTVKNKLTITKPLAQVEEDVGHKIEEDIDLYNDLLRKIPHNQGHSSHHFY